MSKKPCPYCGTGSKIHPVNADACAYYENRDSLQAQLSALREENERLRSQLTIAQRNNHERNVELDALHYVWCTGGCEGGTHRFGEHPPLTEEIVAAAERNTKRLRTRLINREGRLK